MMTTVAEIIRHVEKLSGHPLNQDEGVHHGKDRTVQRALVCWMATADAIQEAGKRGAELIICHESLYYPYNAANRTDNPAGWETWPTNKQRRDLLTQYNLTSLRVHGSADEICIFDDFVDVLGLGQPVYTNGLTKVCEIPECGLGELIERVKTRAGMAHLRVALAGHDLDHKVHRIGLPWGGLGLFVNVGYQEKLIELGCDAFVAGESDSYGFRFCAELGIPMIETSHEDSENPGLRHFTDLLAAAFPEIVFSFHENRRAWEWR
jgi:putative NIF3 family GTP cyclohydrolase 1 type 2